MRKSEEQIKKDVVDQLYWDNRVDASDVKVEVDHNKVRLTGTVPTYSNRWAAEDDAWAVGAQAQVVNELQIKYPEMVAVPNDEQIQSSIQNFILWNPSLDEMKINVRVISGIVYLEGTVDAYWKKVRAEEISGEVIGVLKIINHLIVVPTHDIVDENVAKDIMTALKRSDSVAAANVDISVSDGVVVIKGKVSTSTAYYTVQNTVTYTKGVKRVVNDVQIENPGD